MAFFRITQVVYLLFSVIGVTVFLLALVSVLGWPQLRGRGALLMALGLKLMASGGYAVLGLLNAVGIWSLAPGLSLPPELMQGGYLLLAMVSVAGDCLLAVALWSLGSVFQAIRRESQNDFPPRY